MVLLVIPASGQGLYPFVADMLSRSRLEVLQGIMEPAQTLTACTQLQDRCLFIPFFVGQIHRLSCCLL